MSTTGVTPDVPLGLAMDLPTGTIYWANSFNPQTIFFANLDNTGGGGSLDTTGATVNSPEGMAVDPTN